jgi:hypothetical protein
MLFSHKSPQPPESVAIVPARRHSTPILMMKEVFGMRKPPQAVTRFGVSSEYLFLLPHFHSFFFFFFFFFFLLLQVYDLV